ncbi:putative Heparan-alpha-glucosaminide N-acetyltransferase [Legionella gratiana]|uniref:Heparan-alpha-glucosaminide N-acetyltransferase n=1 Tax=Legionella gratiana TaxID=45066 RepID=A0A378JIY0_9GAMM|nr:heparan-alpha-glucosaminide N-acetyltransferase domain-containing protein [Legionella gratiana]KTD11016.1 putative Heparan-alpha-glucosaminide N-acetyltransferase [Legionella gratiana]STX44640.1 Putative heparan-alpha-glucosaminide N-acetyltransferase [Legionella gratiana]
MSTHLLQNERILSLDVFRGLTMALMVIVNSLGMRISYPILLHSEWDGCTLADLVFPSFLFIVGMTTVISLKKHVKEESKREVYYSIFKRTIILFLFGILINVFPKPIDVSTIRVYGILQRIALCYLICAFLYLHTTVRAQIFIFWGILLGYWYFLTQIHLPGVGVNQLSMARNWVGYIDQLIFSPPHLFFKNFDSEGLLSTIPSVATTLSGVIAGSFLLTHTQKQTKCIMMVAVGLLFLLLGWVWNYSFPINKQLWTSSFVLWCSGFSLIVFSLCYFIIDIMRYTKWSFPFKILGMNALFIFIFHVMLLKIQSFFLLPLPDGTQDIIRVVITEYLFGNFSPKNAGLFYSLMFLFLNFLVASFLYWRKIFIKI